MQVQTHQMADEQGFKDAMATWASGVTVVTTMDAGKIYGLTASSFSSVSLNPPLVLVCLANQNRLPQMIQVSRKFSVSILAKSQQALSNHFARPGREPEDELDHAIAYWSESGLPVLKECAAYMACDLFDISQQGDHCIVIGKAIETYSDSDTEPLLYYRRGYRWFTEHHSSGNSSAP